MSPSGVELCQTSSLRITLFLGQVNRSFRWSRRNEPRRARNRRCQTGAMHSRRLRTPAFAFRVQKGFGIVSHFFENVPNPWLSVLALMVFFFLSLSRPPLGHSSVLKFACIRVP